MHDTTVITKTGEKHVGRLRKFRPEDNFFEIVGTETKRFSFDEVASVITEGERLPQGKIGDMDEVERARKYMIDARRYSWIDPTTPAMDWEKV